jgi:hypothetical protein
MSCVLNRQRASGSGAQGGGSFIVENSLRFDGASRLTKTFDADGDSTTTCTISTWIKRSNLTTAMAVFDAGGYEELRLMATTDRMEIYHDGSADLVVTTQAFRDPTAWFHVVLVFDNTNSTANDRIRIFINGVRVTALDTNTQPAEDDAFSRLLLASHVHSIGSISTGGEYLDGYLAEFILLDGTASTDASEFAEYDSNGNWVPIDPSGLTFGTNGFYLNFAIAPGTGNGAGEDVSGNGNHFTEASLAAADQVSDSPTDSADDDIGNYCTWNPLNTGGAGMTLSNGNLTNTEASGGYESSTGTIGVSSGKYYYELDLGTNSGTWNFGWADETMHGAALVLSTNSARANTWVYVNDSKKAFQGTTDKGVIGTTGTSGEVMMCAIDVDAGYVWWGKQGSWFGDDPDADGSTGDSEALAQGTVYFPFLGNETSTTNIITLNAGQLGFTHTPPTGFKALNTANLPAPAIKDPTEHFAVKLYEGTGASQDIIFGNNTSMDPDLVWIKNRDAADNGHAVDSVRGATKRLPMIAGDTTAIERTDGNGLDDFSVTDGFGLGSGDSVAGYNDNNESFVSYSWKANGSGSSNTDGSINTTKTSANQTAGFSIITYTGTGANATVGHGLGVAPEVIWIKELSDTTGEWHEYNSHNNTSDPETDYRETLEGNTFTDDATFWQDTAPSSTVFSLGNNTKINGDTNTYVAYCWASIPGYSKMGIYTGTAAANGTYVHCGFRPAFIIPIGIANANTYISDHKRNGYNPENKSSLLDSNNVELSTQVVDILSNGFKWRMSGISNAGTYTFMAFAEHPFGGEGVSQARAR